MSPPQLTPYEDVQARSDGFFALSATPWLRVEEPAPRGMIEIRYASRLEEPCIRPILRFHAAGQLRHVLLPAPYAGVGVWFGRLPKDATHIALCPAAEPGPFSFRLLAMRPLSRRQSVACMRLAPKRAFFAAAARCVGLHEEADLNLRWMFGAARSRFAAQEASAVPAKNITDGPPIILWVVAHDSAPAAREATLRSLLGQAYRQWTAVLVGWTGPMPDDPRFLPDPGAQFSPPADTLMGVFKAGDRLAPLALSCWASHFARHSAHTIVYCDHMCDPAPLADQDAAKGLRLVCKPDWSPTRQSFAPYIGRAALFRGSLWSADWPDPETLIDRQTQRAQPNAIGHIRRPLAYLTGPALTPQRPRRPKRPTPQPTTISVIVPTRDRIDLLLPCLMSTLERTVYQSFQILVVDNDSREARTHDVLARLCAADRRVTVLPAPGPFNFARISNAGVRATHGDVLVFLNNDVEILEPHWLWKMLAFAQQPDIGAVGAKLLYPDGHVQHAGVALGLGDVAGHLDASLARDAPGWLGGNLAPHEASAVTGACLMVERAKFEAVGGFDEERLPTELNDIDLCLRLGERGWRTISDCETVLLHRESASRGGDGLRLQRVYEKERRYFSQRWRAVIRDDPYFNPALSLHSRAARPTYDMQTLADALEW